MIEETLVLCAAAGGTPSRDCLNFLLLMQSAGAWVQLGTACTDVSLTRCLQAADACEALRSKSNLKYVLWVDHDMHTNLYNVSKMIRALVAVREQMNLDCCISGAYLNRHKDNKLAAWALKGADSSGCVKVQIGDEVPMTLIPALCGLGAFLQSKESFLAHCDESEHMCYPTENTIVPVVCQSHPVHASELAEFIHVDANKDRYYWQGEDFDYCTREFDAGRPVYLAPIDWAHESRGILMPDDNTVFPGLGQLSAD
jgi:hypothetical protein